MISHDQYLQFMKAVKKIVVLELFIRVIALDRKNMERVSLKLQRAYIDALDQIQLLTEEDLRQTRISLRKDGGRILTVTQNQVFREVQAMYRGHVFTFHYMNDVLRSECEICWKQYMQSL